MLVVEHRPKGCAISLNLKLSNFESHYKKLDVKKSQKASENWRVTP